jgi:hypothetical protein
MRRAYNGGQWARARNIAKKLLHIPKEQELARSVIIRSLYNEGKFDELIELNVQWGNRFDYLLEKMNNSQSKSSSDISRLRGIQLKQPQPKNTFEFDEQSTANNFSQENNRVWMRHPHGYTYWDMPASYSLQQTHPDLLRLVAEILLYPWYQRARVSLEGSRAKGSHISLSFSAGIDSTAAMLVMPKSTILGYHRRSFDTILDHRNADRLLKQLHNEGRTIIDVSSNHELIRTYHGKQIGFSSDFAASTHLILLADFHDIGALGFGTPIDNTYLSKGRKYRDFAETDYYNYWTRRFAGAGIDLLFPIASISEGGALEIVRSSKIRDLVNSCLRGDGISGCGKCWKCFHKNGPLGRDFDIGSREIQIFLRKSPMPTTTHALWALQIMGLEEKTPHLSNLLKNDYSWWIGFYPPALELLQPSYRDFISNSIQQIIAPMEEPFELEKLNHYDE